MIQNRIYKIELSRISQFIFLSYMAIVVAFKANRLHLQVSECLNVLDLYLDLLLH